MEVKAMQARAIGGWRDCDISDLCQLQRGFDLTEATRKRGVVPVYSSSGISYFHSEAKLQPPSVITGRKGLLGRVFFVEEPCWPHDTTLWVKDFKGNDPRFVALFLRAFRLERFDAATSVPTLNRNNLVGHPIRIPPTPEQRVIASALSDVDALLSGLDRLIAKKRDLKQASMQQLLTGQTRLPGFEGEWEVKRLGDLLTICHGKSQREVEVDDGAYPILATGGRIGTAKRALYDKPSVLIGRKGTINQPQYMNTPFWTVDTLFYSAIKDDNSARFLYYRFCLIDWMQYNEASGVPSLNARTIENIEVDFPEPVEQKAIAAVLSDMDAELTALEARREKTRLLKLGMMQELLTGKTRLISPEPAHA